MNSLQDKKQLLRLLLASWMRLSLYVCMRMGAACNWASPLPCIHYRRSEVSHCFCLGSCIDRPWSALGTYGAFISNVFCHGILSLALLDFLRHGLIWLIQLRKIICENIYLASQIVLIIQKQISYWLSLTIMSKELFIFSFIFWALSSKQICVKKGPPYSCLTVKTHYAYQGFLKKGN